MKTKRQIDRMHREYREKQSLIISVGKCPVCGAGLRRNNALTGWWQCEQYGAPGFRKDDSRPACGWQTFTE
jgi:coenzyme F420-reducing hydrogenase gamma subunit